MPTTKQTQNDKLLQSITRRLDHFERIMRDEIRLTEAWIKFFLASTLHDPEGAVRALDDRKEQLQGKDRGRMKRCIRGINKSWKAYRG